MNWLLDNLCFLCVSGSQGYGTNNEFSDVDVKGIVLPPKEIREHLFSQFNQTINNKLIENKYSYIKNPKNPKFESTVYSLSKFIQLAAQVNPNIIELLWSDESCILEKNKIGQKLLENRDLFLSTKAKFTFSGYAFAQFAKIERHRKWLVKGELKEPQRKDYGLSGESLKGFGEIERIIKKDIENWNLSKFKLDDLDRQDLKQNIFDCVFNLTKNTITWDNWPQKYEDAALDKFLKEFNVPKDITNLILRETKFKNDLREYHNWLRWKEKRNLERKQLEKEYLYDTKHAMHLFRLLRMGCEILEGKGVITKRHDAAELLEIRYGVYTYEKLTEEFKKLNEKLENLYKITKLSKSVNYEKINNLYLELLSI